MPKVLVTGAGGFIGRNVVRALSQQGANVHGCGRISPVEPEISPHTCDLADAIATRALLNEVRPDTVVHCAWITTHGLYWQAPENRNWADWSLNLLEAAAVVGVRRFVGVGTCAEYRAAGQSALRESDEIAPATPYGEAKDSFRRSAEAFSGKAGIAFAWARVFMLFGAGEHKDRLVSSLARSFVRGLPARMSNGYAVRDFLDVRDAGAAIAALALCGATGAVNIGSGVPTRVRDVGELLARLSGRPEVLQIGALSDRPNEPAWLVANTARLIHEVGFSPAIPLESGLADALAHWRSRENT